ncbi:hypothetical protein [Noviherbaspirillum denitrificans]|uniref:Uncharacterized protein n=1 Tax=Noviherbaspirillum denitrificans TaxID=1968433 RepID=A0A254TJJ5_9BURK|nr:hypothetical protein [Noviherbaspirillum denitrificans]OWW22357.1 hypothetical protein AYR66_25540 [Noviherbaspirillum denitrificans]
MAKASAPQVKAKTPVKKTAAAKPVARKAAPAKATQAQVKAIAAKAPKVPASVPDKPVSEPKEKVKKPKLVRDSFTMPEAEYAVLGEVKKACLKAGIEVKKSELLRVGVALIRQLDTAKLKEILAGLPTLKAGRPKKNK